MALNSVYQPYIDQLRQSNPSLAATFDSLNGDDGAQTRLLGQFAMGGGSGSTSASSYATPTLTPQAPASPNDGFSTGAGTDPWGGYKMLQAQKPGTWQAGMTYGSGPITQAQADQLNFVSKEPINPTYDNWSGVTNALKAQGASPTTITASPPPGSVPNPVGSNAWATNANATNKTGANGVLTTGSLPKVAPAPYSGYTGFGNSQFNTPPGSSGVTPPPTGTGTPTSPPVSTTPTDTTTPPTGVPSPSPTAPKSPNSIVPLAPAPTTNGGYYAGTPPGTFPRTNYKPIAPAPAFPTMPRLNSITSPTGFSPSNSKYNDQY